MQINAKTQNFICLLLRLSFAGVLFGRAWQAFRFDLPLRTIFWNQGILEPFLIQFGYSWESYVNSSALALTIEAIQYGIAGFWGLLGALVLGKYFEKRNRETFWITNLLIGLGVLSLFILAFLYMMNDVFRVGRVIEYASQYMVGIFYLAAIKDRLAPSIIKLALLAVSMTFWGHGLYALGYYPQPGYFLEMTMSITHLGESASRIFLIVAGVLDLVVAVMIWVPKFSLAWLRYAFFWGFLTAFARIWANLDWVVMGQFSENWIHEFLIRTPHFLLPLFLIVYLGRVLNLTHSSSELPSIWTSNTLVPKTF